MTTNFLSDQLKNRDLVVEGSWIDGVWNPPGDGTFEVVNPADGSALGRLPRCGSEATEKAIRAAAEAFPGWSGLLAKERADYVLKWFDAVIEHLDDLATIVTWENGKPLAESKNEALYCASFLRWFAEEGRRTRGDVIPEVRPASTIMTVMQPVGVVGAIAPWNFPLAMITRKLGAALSAGCTAVIKPSELTPFSCIALMRLAESAGIPKGVLNMVFGDAPAIGKTLCESRTVKKITFTGSTKVGKLLMRDSAANVKKLSLELGGNAPFIVFEDADLDKAVNEAVLCKFRNAGQTCVCANRIFVQEKAHDPFVAKLADRMRAFKVGFGIDPETKIGPLINASALEKVKRHVGDALSKGGKIVVGGKPHPLGGHFFEPTLVTGLADDCALFGEETFGPVAGVFRFRTEEEAVRRANSTEYGLAGYFFTRDLARAMRVSRRLELGIVGVNSGIISSDVAPFGGVKESGLGKEGSHMGIAEFMETKYVLIAE